MWRVRWVCGFSGGFVVVFCLGLGFWLWTWGFGFGFRGCGFWVVDLCLWGGFLDGFVGRCYDLCLA